LHGSWKVNLTDISDIQSITRLNLHSNTPNCKMCMQPTHPPIVRTSHSQWPRISMRLANRAVNKSSTISAIEVVMLHPGLRGSKYDISTRFPIFEFIIFEKVVTAHPPSHACTHHDARTRMPLSVGNHAQLHAPHGALTGSTRSSGCSSRVWAPQARSLHAL